MSIHDQSKDLCQIVDENDQIIGYKLRSEIDFKKDYYRISCLWLTNSKGEVLLAQRKLTKDKDPGKWGPSAAGTLEKGETYKSNVVKEAKEELGLDGVAFKQRATLKLEEPRKAFLALFTGVSDWPASRFTPQPEEVEQVAWVNLATLKKDTEENPDKYVPSIKVLLETVGNNQRQTRARPSPTAKAPLVDAIKSSRPSMVTVKTIRLCYSLYMNKLKLALVALLSIFVLAAPVAVHAQTTTVDDSTIQNSLQEQGLDQAPEVITVPETQMVGPERSSGFVDDNGQPISEEEYAKIREEQSKGIFEKQPILSALVGLVILGGIVGLVVMLVARSKGKKRAATTQPINAPVDNPVVGQPNPVIAPTPPLPPNPTTNPNPTAPESGPLPPPTEPPQQG